MDKKKDVVYTKKEMAKRLNEIIRKSDEPLMLIIHVGEKIEKPGTAGFIKLMDDIRKNMLKTDFLDFRCGELISEMESVLLSNDPIMFRKFEVEYYRLDRKSGCAHKTFSRLIHKLPESEKTKLREKMRKQLKMMTQKLNTLGIFKPSKDGGTND